MPARIISDFLHVMNLASFKIEHYSGTQKKPVPVIRYHLSREVAGERVLLVDDVCDTGDTFEVAGKHLAERMEPKEIRSAVMHYKKVSRFTPDYYAGRIIKWRWIIYPWAVAEDISEFIRSMDTQPETVSKIRKKLNQEYGVRISAPVLEDILALSQIKNEKQ